MGSCPGVVCRGSVLVVAGDAGASTVGVGTEGTTVDATTAEGEAWRRHSCRYARIFWRT